MAVLGDDPHLLASGHIRDVSGDREATLEVVVVARRADDARVDELVQVALDLDHARLEGHAQLRRGQAYARCGTHGVRQVVEQLVQVLAEAVDRLALEAQPGVTEGDDWLNCHAAEYRSEAP